MLFQQLFYDDYYFSVKVQYIIHTYKVGTSRQLAETNTNYPAADCCCWGGAVVEEINHITFFPLQQKLISCCRCGFTFSQSYKSDLIHGSQCEELEKNLLNYQIRKMYKTSVCESKTRHFGVNKSSVPKREIKKGLCIYCARGKRFFDLASRDSIGFNYQRLVCCLNLASFIIHASKVPFALFSQMRSTFHSFVYFLNV